MHEPLDEVTDAVLAASRVLVAVSARSIQSFESRVTLPQFRLLVVLRARGPSKIGRLADELGVVPSTATRLCERLVASGLAHRSPSELDRREVILAITDEGVSLVDEVNARRREEIRDVLAKMHPDQQRGLVTALRAFSEAAGEVPEFPWSPRGSASRPITAQAT